ncbi:hypothetical protein GGU11DRAFT_745260 [Lentinula aff. detonsa]|nr:hypothetical protein GGU11DRAFT_745260 [Lentinula aff. detonsa]
MTLAVLFVVPKRKELVRAYKPADGAHKGRVVFSGTKVLQANGSSAVADGVPEPLLKTPDDDFLY